MGYVGQGNVKLIKAEVARGGEECCLAVTYPSDLGLREKPPSD